jgi:hypothetical protein
MMQQLVINRIFRAEAETTFDERPAGIEERNAND